MAENSYIPESRLSCASFPTGHLIKSELSLGHPVHTSDGQDDDFSCGFKISILASKRPLPSQRNLCYQCTVAE